MTMLAYHNDESLRQTFLSRVRAHHAADEIIKGAYWRNGKGCAFGCMFHTSNHMASEEEAGIPVMLSRLQDNIFENLPNDKAKQWVLDYPEAIRAGQDLSRVGWKFLHWLLTESNPSAFGHPLIRDAVKQCTEVLVPLTRGLPIDRKAAARAAEAAEAAAWATEWAAAEAAEAAAWAAWATEWAAAEAAEAAEAVAWAARAAAWAAEAVAWAARAAAEAAEAAEATAWAAAEADFYEKVSVKLLELIREAPQTAKGVEP